MSKVMVVTSGKGGSEDDVLGVGVARRRAGPGEAGGGSVVVDFDVGLRNLDLVMGAERRVVFDLVNVVQGDAKLPQALIRDKRLETLSLLPASQTRDKDALTEDGVARRHRRAARAFDWIICDSPAGIEKGATLAMRFADVAVVVTNPEVSSVRDSDRIIGMLDSKTVPGRERRAHREEAAADPLRRRRAPPRGEMMKVEDVLEILAIPLLGIIVESPDVLDGLEHAAAAGHPAQLGLARPPRPTPTRPAACWARPSDQHRAGRNGGASIEPPVRAEGGRA